MIRTFIESKDLIKDITSDIVLEVNKLISVAFMPEFMNSCKNTFGNLEKTLVKEPVITIIYREYHFVIDLKNGKSVENKYKTGTIKKDRF